MSVRLEWGAAGFMRPTVHREGDVLADGQKVTSPFALGFGYQVIEGTPDALCGYLDAAVKKLREAILPASLLLNSEELEDLGDFLMGFDTQPGDRIHWLKEKVYPLTDRAWLLAAYLNEDEGDDDAEG